MASCKYCRRKFKKGLTMNECEKCGTRFCSDCEKKFRAERGSLERTFCRTCFPEYKKLVKDLSLNTYEPR